MRRFLMVAMAVVVLVPGAALAEPFSGASLLVGRSVKPDKAAKKFSLGVNLGVSPMNLATNLAKGKILESAKQKAIDEICTQSVADPACEEAAAEYVDNAMAVVADMPEEQWDQLVAVLSGTDAEVREVLADAGIADKQTQDDVIQLQNELPGSEDERAATLGLAREVATSEAVNLLLEPYLDMNFKWVEIEIGVPMTLQIFTGENSGEETRFSMGNIHIDIKSGKVWTAGEVVTIGISGGLHTYLPTTYWSEYASDAVISDMFVAPKFLYRTLTVSPYLVVGLDLAEFFELQVHGEFPLMFDVSDDGTPTHFADGSTLQYFKYGVGMIILPDFLLSIVGELNGLVPINNADSFDALFVVGGIQLKIAWLKMSLAAQAPVVQSASLKLTEENMDTLSKVTVLARLGFNF